MQHLSLAFFRIPFIVLITLFCAPSVSGQGFNSFNGRNHPELDWQVAETPHFRIMYPAHLAGIEQEVAPIAEASYMALSANLGVDFEDPIRIYLSDEDEILNGFATRLGYTNIWVHVNDVARQWTGNTKWLRTVVSHELAHLFHGKAVKGNRGLLLDYLAGDPMPSFWTEGIAQYQAELWDTNRGERWLRTAILDDRLSYSDGLSIWNGRLLYAVGNAQLRYLTSQYGDSTVSNILHYKKSSVFGLLRTHDFYTAFEAETDKSYRVFYDEWRRHMNIYYNTLAGQMENVDSLQVDPQPAPGQYISDVQFSPDTTYLATLSLTSIARPVTRLYVRDMEAKKTRIVAEGAIRPPFSWHPDETAIAFTRRTRNHQGSIINDLFLVDIERRKTRRLTYGRRAVAPAFSPDGTQLAFIGSQAGTGNVFLLDLASMDETQVTQFEGDVQLSSLTWQPTSNQLAFSVFDADGNRTIHIADIEKGIHKVLPDTLADNQFPIWSPDQQQIAYTSLRDHVPNVFIHDLETDSTHRVTRLVTGASVTDWVLPDSTYPEGSLLITSGTSKQRDRVYRIPASRRVIQPEIQIPEPYTKWTTHRPPHRIPHRIAPTDTLITRRASYKALRNLTHAFSFALPYYNASDDWGIAGATSWTEPLAKHNLGVTASLSFPNPANSFLAASYINNQLRPTLTFSGYQLIPIIAAYGRVYGIYELSGADVSINWPLDVAVRPYTSTRLELQFQYQATRIVNDEDFAPLPHRLLTPEEGEQLELSLAIQRRTLRPYRNNLIHPLDGLGIRAEIRGAPNVLGADTRYIRGDVSAFAVLPMPGLHRLYVYGKVQALSGSTFNQDQLGFARFDDFQVVAPQFGIMAFSDAERVRGFSQFAYGNRLLFGSIEYRIPLIPDLQTELLGLIDLGASSLSLFADAGGVWNNTEVVTRRLGLGAEFKNVLTIGGVLQIMHAVGVGQPAPNFGTTDDYEIYYRLRTTLPF